MVICYIRYQSIKIIFILRQWQNLITFNYVVEVPTKKWPMEASHLNTCPISDEIEQKRRIFGLWCVRQCGNYNIIVEAKMSWPMEYGLCYWSCWMDGRIWEVYDDLTATKIDIWSLPMFMKDYLDAIFFTIRCLLIMQFKIWLILM